MITLFLLKGSSTCNNADRARESWGSLAVRVIQSDRNLDIQRVLTPFYAYMYEDEYLSPELRKALDTFLLHPAWDALVLVRRTPQNRFFEAPRIFRGLVPLDGNLTPARAINGRVRYLRVLDGFILGA